MAFGLGFHIISAPSFASQAIFLPPRFSATAPRLRALHRAEDIGSALKGGVNVCQRQLVNEVLGSLVTEFVRNFGREGATPIQLGSHASLLGGVRAVKLTRHNALPTSHSRPFSLIGVPLSASGSIVPANSTSRAAIGSSERGTLRFAFLAI